MEKIIRTIVVDDNNVVVNNLVTHFQDKQNVKIVATFDNGEDALNYIIGYKDNFDLIVMDVLLPKIDGAMLLDELRKLNIKKTTIILSNYKDSKIIDDCTGYNVAHYMLKPFSIISLEKKIIDTFTTKKELVTAYNSHNLDLEISQLLHNLGIPSHIRGYKYIRDGIMIIFNNDATQLITKEIYPQIAYKYETTPSRVERAIRHAIEVSCIRGDLSLMEELFGFSVSCDKAKPTNSEFLSTIADRIKLDHNLPN